MASDIQRTPPLPPATLHILLALSSSDLHGYGIMQEVLRQTEGSYKLGPGTLYDNLQRLLDQGLVTELAGGEDSRRRVYRLNPSGRAALSHEITRLDAVVRTGKLNLQTGGA
ncbi:MAG: PadR family transcriptional regulator [Acidobacteriota bacterium]